MESSARSGCARSGYSCRRCSAGRSGARGKPRAASGRWQSLLPAAFQAVLLTAGRARSNKLPWIALGLAWLLTLLALLGPSWQRLEQASQKRADPLVVLLELTPAMLATHAAPNRLEQAKRKIIDLLQARRDAQTAIIVYAGSAHVLVPLSDDLATARNLLEAVKPSIMPEPGAAPTWPCNAPWACWNRVRRAVAGCC